MLPISGTSMMVISATVSEAHISEEEDALVDKEVAEGFDIVIDIQEDTAILTSSPLPALHGHIPITKTLHLSFKTVEEIQVVT